MFQELLVTLIPVIVAAASLFLVEGLQQLNARIEKLHPALKRVIVTTAAFFLTKATAAGVALSGTDVTALTQDDLGALLSAGLAFVFHLGDKLKKEAANA